MKILKNGLLYILIIVLVVADQLSKYIVVSRLSFREVIPVIDDFFYITYVRNSGGAFSLLSQQSWGIYLLSVLSLVIVVLLLFAMHRFKHDMYRWVRVGLAVLCGGAIGNLIDRIFEGAVVDFLMFVFGSYTFPIFNIADICIVVASISLAAMLIFDKKLLHSDMMVESSKTEMDEHSFEDNTDEQE